MNPTRTLTTINESARRLAGQADRTIRHGVDRLRRRAARRLRWNAGRIRGDAYRVSGHHPDYDVPNRVLAERIRAELGGHLKHRPDAMAWVEARRHIAYLRGRVSTPAAARDLERRILAVPGVEGVQSYVEIIAGDGAPAASPALRRMLDAARREGSRPPNDRTALRGALATFAARIPLGELEDVWDHLPADVREFLQPPVTLGVDPGRVRHTADFFEIVACAVGFDTDAARRLTLDVLRELASLVPEEAADIRAVLPRDLKQMWELAGAM